MAKAVEWQQNILCCDRDRANLYCPIDKQNLAQRILQNVADELLAALDQEAVLSGNKEAVELVHLFAPEHPDLSLPENCGWSIVPIEIGQIPVLAHYPTVPTNYTGMNQCLA